MSLFQEACGFVGPLKLSIRHADGLPEDLREFTQPYLVVGREPKTDLPLNDPAVSYRHVYLQAIAGQIYCVDLFSRTGVRCAGGNKPAGWLGPDQPFGVGPFTLQLHDAPHPRLAEAADPMASRGRDQVSLPPVSVEILLENQTVVWPMNRILAIVGQEPRCKVHLKAAGVSSAHCSLLRTPKGLFVVDLASSAGTVVNGKPVPWARLDDGDELRVGVMRLRVNYPESRQSAAVTPPSGVFVPSTDEIEKLRGQVDELTRSLVAADEYRAGLIRSGEEASRRWEAERNSIRCDADGDRQRLVSEVDALRAESATQRAALEAEFQRERERYQDQINALMRDAVASADGSSGQEQQALRDEAERLRGDAEALRAERDEAVSRLTGVAADADSARAEAAGRVLELQRELSAAREEADAERRSTDEVRAGRARDLQVFRDEVAGLRTQLESAMADAATQLRQREGELAAARAEWECERKALNGELDQARRAVDDRQAQLDERAGQASARERQYQEQMTAAHAEWTRERQDLRDEVVGIRRELESLRDELATAKRDATAKEQLGLSEFEAFRTRADEERQHLVAEADTLRQTVESHRVELATAHAQAEHDRQGLQTQVAALQQRANLTPPVTPDTTLAKLTDQFRVAAGRFNNLVDQIETLHAELRERSKQREESRRGVLSRFLGGSRGDEAETSAAVERRLAAMRADAVIEQERAALLASEAARADLEQRLAEALRQLHALSGQ